MNTEQCMTLKDNNIISIKVPFQIKRKAGRKTLLLPDQDTKRSLDNDHHNMPDETMLKALAKAYYWQKQIKRGKYTSIEDISQKRKVNSSYVSRILKLNYLAPKIKQAILDGTQPRRLMLQDLLKPFPDLWDDQLQYFGFSS